MMWALQQSTDVDGTINKLTLSFRFLGRHTGAGRFFRQADGLFLLQISDRWGTYDCPSRYRLDEIDTYEKASAICTVDAEVECSKDET
ncbi:hypothetical protein LC593_34955 [Nostoc sp. CHAB 5844]|nr:hypothetical protein [Nostoc sp. CHAB 5844]